MPPRPKMTLDRLLIELRESFPSQWHVPEDQVELVFSHAEGRDLFNELKEIQRRSDNYGLLLLIFSKANPVLFNELKNARVI